MVLLQSHTLQLAAGYLNINVHELLYSYAVIQLTI